MEYTVSELEEMLEKAKGKERIENKPVMIINPDLTKLKQELFKYVEYVYEYSEEPKDGFHNIAEAVVLTFYGSEFFYWLDKILGE